MTEYELKRFLEWEKEWIAKNNGHDWSYVGKNPVELCRRCGKLRWQAEKICPGTKAPEGDGNDCPGGKCEW